MNELDCKDCYYKDDCFYLDFGREKDCIKKKNRNYCCEDCGFDPMDITDLGSPELFYYIENGKAKPIYDSWIDDPENKEYGAMKPNEQVLGMISTVKKVVIYPIRDNFLSDYDYNSGTSGCGWRETHKCPKCNKEFIYYNSTL